MRRRGFTLIELLVVISIILLISVIAIPTIRPAFAHRQVSEAARLVQGALAGARDDALRTNTPSGIRLLPDPAFPPRYLPNGQLDPNQPLVANRIIPIAPAPNYSEGTVFVDPTQSYTALTNLPCLVAEEGVGKWVPLGNGQYRFEIDNPVSWMWNIRVGDKIQINNAGQWYTVVGPMVIGPGQGNSELFVNIGQAGTPSNWSRAITAPNGQSITVNPEYLFLVNGRDDNKNGWIDEGFDGVDNNRNGQIDEPAEWEQEVW